MQIFAAIAPREMPVHMCRQPPSTAQVARVTESGIVASLRSGAWLRGGRTRVLATALLLFDVAALTFFVLGTHGLITPLAQPTTTDFASFYAAGMLADQARPDAAYDETAHRQAEERATQPGISYNFFYYPPTFLLLCAPLARLPYLPAFLLFEAVTGMLALAAAWRIVGRLNCAAVLAMLAFPAVFWTIGLGQNGLLTAALIGAATLLIDDRPIVAGLLFGALCCKPHFGLLVPVALAAGRRWRAFAAAALAVLALVTASLLLFGASTWQAYLARAAGSAQTYAFGRIPFSGMISVFGAVRLAGGGLDLAYAAQLAAALVATAVMAWLWWTDARLEDRAASLIAATLLSIPVVLFYDLTLAGIAMAWLVRGRRTPDEAAWLATVCVAIYLIALLTRNIGETYGLPLGPVPALLLLWLAARGGLATRRARIRWPAPASAPPGPG